MLCGAYGQRSHLTELPTSSASTRRCVLEARKELKEFRLLNDGSRDRSNDGRRYPPEIRLRAGCGERAIENVPTIERSLRAALEVRPRRNHEDFFAAETTFGCPSTELHFRGTCPRVEALREERLFGQKPPSKRHRTNNRNLNYGQNSRPDLRRQ